MKNKSWIWISFIVAGALPIWNALQYFIDGKAYQNSNLRNYAVVGQIIFGVAIIFYGFWYKKNLSQQNK
ncbi:MAG: hypothetical protein WKF90_08435 [Pyrinomonadaceae bacterium]